MALQGKPGLIQYDGGVLICDMLVDASAVHTLQLTEHPIETNAIITDHAIFRPFVLDVTLVQTETPISPIDGFSQTVQTLSHSTRPDGRQANELNIRTNDRIPANANQLIGAVSSRILGAGRGPIVIEGAKADTPLQAAPLRVTALTANAPVERVNRFYADLLSLMLGVTPLNVTIKGATHIDMVITSLTRQDTPGQVGMARFVVSMQRIATISTQTVELPPVPEVTRKQGRGKKDGKVETPPPTEKTLLASGADAGVTLGGAVKSFFGGN
jgi:hypothetical protein